MSAVYTIPLQLTVVADAEMRHHKPFKDEI
jgi:hypothetical protein